MIFIPENVPALKNSKKIITLGKRCPVCKKGAYSSLVPSSRVEKWRRDTKPFWLKHKAEFLSDLEQIELPAEVAFIFVRGSRHKFDYTNALDTVQDEMVKHGWLEDDNADCIIPVIEPYRYDKELPGVFIEVLL